MKLLKLGVIFFVFTLCSCHVVNRNKFSGMMDFMALVRESPGGGYCSASVVGNEWLLTSAHCNFRRGDEVLVGRREAEGRPDARVVNFIPHSLYPGDVSSSRAYAYDIALVRIQPPLKNFQAISLDYSTVDVRQLIGVRALSVGYGECDNDRIQNRNPILRWKERLLIKCSMLQLNSFMICSFGDPVCWPGDSGGPLVARERETRRLVQIAVHKGTKGKTMFGPSVAMHREWIRNVMNHF